MAAAGPADSGAKLNLEELELAAILYMQKDTEQTLPEKAAWLQTYGNGGGTLQGVPKHLCSKVTSSAKVRDFQWPPRTSIMKKKHKDRRSRIFYTEWSKCLAHVAAHRGQLQKVTSQIKKAANAMAAASSKSQKQTAAKVPVASDDSVISVKAFADFIKTALKPAARKELIEHILN